MDKSRLEKVVTDSWHYLSGYTVNGMGAIACVAPKDYKRIIYHDNTFQFHYPHGSGVLPVYGRGGGIWVEALIFDSFVPLKGASIHRGKGLRIENKTERKLVKPETGFWPLKKPAQYQTLHSQVEHPVYLDLDKNITSAEIPQRRLNAFLMSAFDFRLRGGAFVAYALVTTEDLADALEIELRQKPGEIVTLFETAFPQYKGFIFDREHKTPLKLTEFVYIATDTDIKEILKRGYPLRGTRLIEHLENR